MPVLQVRVTEEEHAAIKVAAAKRGMTVTDLVKRLAVEDPDEPTMTDQPVPISVTGKMPKVPASPKPVVSTPPRPESDSYSAFRPVPKPGTKRR